VKRHERRQVCPAEDPAFQGRAAGQRLLDAVVDPLEDLGDADLDGGLEFPEVVHQPVDAFRIGPDNAQVHRGIDGHPLEHVGERQEGEAEVALLVVMHPRGVEGRVVEVGVGDHGPFRRAGRPGGVGDRGQILRPDGATDRPEALRRPLVQDPPFCLEVLPSQNARRQGRPAGREDDQGLRLPQRLADGQERLEDRVVFRETAPQPAVADDVGRLLKAGRGIQTDRDPAGGEDGEIRVGPLRPGHLSRSPGRRGPSRRPAAPPGPPARSLASSVRSVSRV